MKKMFLVLAVLLTVVGAAFAQIKRPGAVADLGDVRIYSLGSGNFEVESDRVQQCFSLNFRQSGGWIEVACSSYAKKVEAASVGYAAKWAVKAYLTAHGVVNTGKAETIAEAIASWAASKGIDYLCN